MCLPPVPPHLPFSSISPPFSVFDSIALSWSSLCFPGPWPSPRSNHVSLVLHCPLTWLTYWLPQQQGQGQGQDQSGLPFSAQPHPPLGPPAQPGFVTPPPTLAAFAIYTPRTSRSTAATATRTPATDPVQNHNPNPNPNANRNPNPDPNPNPSPITDRTLAGGASARLGPGSSVPVLLVHGGRSGQQRLDDLWALPLAPSRPDHPQVGRAAGRHGRLRS